tara:strand:- start:3 stop:713 length:711 start_codon:yes stop_codon:yes gene_type:complete
MIEIFELKDALFHFDKIKTVMKKNNLLIIKNFIDSDFMNIRKQLLLFSDSEKEVIEPTNFKSSWHRYDVLPKKSVTKHITHFYNFNLSKPYNLDFSLYFELRIIFTKMLLIQNALAGTTATLCNSYSKKNNDRPILRPQIIHYPKGGGSFDKHNHPYLPQKYGLILLLSQKNKDYMSGGTRVYIDNNVIDTSEYANQGDLIIFKYDLPHDITPCDPHEELDFDRIDGRWTAILPFY